MANKKEPLKDIRTSLLTRGFKIAKAGLRAGRVAAGMGSSDKPAWLEKIEILVEEMGQLKGTAMKVGQTMSMYGEHLLPKEVNEVFKKLQQESPPVSWSTMGAILRNEIGETELEVIETPLAAASIGQVHAARLKDQELAVKIQYAGIDKAVETDLKLLKFILNMTEMVPRGPRFDQIFAEIRTMFHQEIDYEFERRAGEQFREWLKDDSRYLVPRFYPEYSTKRVLTMDRLPGVRADHPSVQALSQERRNRLGMMFLDLYLRELLEFKCVQTDPHLGNYLIDIREDGHDRLVLLDFGAVRDVPADFLQNYRLLIEGGIERDARKIEKAGRLLGLLQPDDSLELVNDSVALGVLLTEPFTSGVYDWGASDLPKRVAGAVGKIATTYRLRAPPRELVFLDRKLGGVFIFLSVLGCKMDARESVVNALTNTGR